MRVVMKDREDFLRDPVFFFIALAISDKAFRGISSLDQFWAVRPPSNRSQFEFQWDAAVMDTPVLRKADRLGKVSSQAWSVSCTFDVLNNLTRMAGYPKGSLTMYSFRCGFGNSIDSE